LLGLTVKEKYPYDGRLESALNVYTFNYIWDGAFTKCHGLRSKKNQDRGRYQQVKDYKLEVEGRVIKNPAFFT